jgi:hypothetical protein
MCGWAVILYVRVELLKPSGKIIQRLRPISKYLSLMVAVGLLAVRLIVYTSILANGRERR